MGRAFNRTIVELKQLYLLKTFKVAKAFNRTIVELKRGRGGERIAKNVAFNRTIVELKHEFDTKNNNRMAHF